MPAPVVEKECDWTGFYIGVHGGYLWGDPSLHETGEGDDNPFYHLDPASFFGGGQIGYNRQFGSWFVIGVEGEFSGTDFDDEKRVVEDEGKDGLETSFGRVDADWFATAGARIGASFWRNRLLAYVKGGAVFTEFDVEVEDVGDENELWHGEDDRIGGFVGGGLEYAINCHWSVKVEYQHYFFDDETITGVALFEGVPGTVEKPHDLLDPALDSVRVGLNFRF